MQMYFTNEKLPPKIWIYKTDKLRNVLHIATAYLQNIQCFRLELPQNWQNKEKV